MINMGGVPNASDGVDAGVSAIDDGDRPDDLPKDGHSIGGLFVLLSFRLSLETPIVTLTCS